MPTSLLLAFALFAFVSSVTPGPNNMMLLASGVNFGLRASVPHIAGISIGFFVMLVAVGLGLGEVFVRLPMAFVVLKWAGAAYLLYLAWKVARAAPPSEGAAGVSARPMSFWAAAAFQWANPKAWVMALTAFSTYAPGAPSLGLVLGVAGLFALINAPSVSVWAAAGARLRLALRHPPTLRLFNYSMAALLVASLYPLLQTA